MGFVIILSLHRDHTYRNEAIVYVAAPDNLTAILESGWLSFSLYPTLAHLDPTFTAEMTTYYFKTFEEALKGAKNAGKRPGCWYGGIVLKSGRRGFAVYREGKVVEQYSVIGR